MAGKRLQQAMAGYWRHTLPEGSKGTFALRRRNATANTATYVQQVQPMLAAHGTHTTPHHTTSLEKRNDTTHTERTEQSLRTHGKGAEDAPVFGVERGFRGASGVHAI